MADITVQNSKLSRIAVRTDRPSRGRFLTPSRTLAVGVRGGVDEFGTMHQMVGVPTLLRSAGSLVSVEPGYIVARALSHRVPSLSSPILFTHPPQLPLAPCPPRPSTPSHQRAAGPGGPAL